MLKGRKISPALLFAPTVLALCILHWLRTVPVAFLHDRYGRTEYINFIATHFRLPPPNHCSQCMQPPLYHVLAAFPYKLGLMMGVDPMNVVSFCSIFFYAGYLYFAAKLIEENVADRALQFVVTALVFFWPLGFHMARNISNDVPLIMSQTAVLYYSLRWWKRLRADDLIKAILWTCLAINFKFNGLVTAFILAGMILAQYGRTRFAWRQTIFRRDIVIVAVIAAFFAAVPLLRNIYFYSFQLEHPKAPVIFKFMFEEDLMLGNHLFQYFTFDLWSYLTVPFYDVTNDVGGRQYFWNAVLKTSLFDEYPWRSPNLALLLSGSELLLIIYMLIANINALLKGMGADRILYLSLIGTNLLMLGIYRVCSPLSCTQEYRYVYIITPVFALLYARALEYYELQNNALAQKCGLALGWAFAALSILFIVSHDIQ